MRITAVEEYGLRCLLALARKGQGGHLTIPEIAQLEGLSVPYASKLLAILRKAGFVSAVRGRTGGFCIAHAPEAINLYDVVTALGGPLIDPDHCQRFAGNRETCVHLENCSVHNMLDGLTGYMEVMLRKITLKDMIEKESMVTHMARPIPSTTSVSGMDSASGS
jgi:Rrf2 family protein